MIRKQRALRDLSAGGMLIVVIACAGVAIGTLAAAGVFSGGGDTTARQGALARPLARELFAAERHDVTDRKVILRLLDRYQTDYSEADLPALAELFTPTVERRGLGARGCASVHGRSAVLTEYASQFAANGHTRYRLLGLTSTSIQFREGRRARVGAIYSLPRSGNTGSIEFTLVQEGGSWLIARIIATCKPIYKIPKPEVLPPSESAAPTTKPVIRVPRATP